MNVGDLLDETFGLYRRNFALFAGVVAVLTIPETLLNMAVTASMPTVPFTFPGITGSTGQVYLPSSSFDPLGSVLTSVIGVIFGVLIWAALAQAISARYLGHEISVWLAYTSSPVSTYGTLLAGLVLVGIAAVIVFGVVVLVGVLVTVGLASAATALGVLFAIFGTLAAVCAAIFIGVRLSFFPQAVVLERAGIIAALKRSWHLVGGSWWRVFGIFVLLSILVNILQGVLLLLAGSLILFGHGTPAYLVLTQAASGIGKILIEPIQFGALTLLYYDLRVRKEALDLELAVMNMETTSPT